MDKLESFVGYWVLNDFIIGGFMYSKRNFNLCFKNLDNFFKMYDFNFF